MRTILFLSVFTLLCVNSFGEDYKALDDKYGFREAKFETPLSSFKNLIEIEKNLYKCTTEDLKLGNYRLSEVNYQFYRGQLCVITIDTKGYENGVGILKIFQAAYGKGVKSNEYIEDYYWNGKKVLMSYEQNSVTGDATIFIFCNKLTDLKDANEKKANEEAAKNL